MELFKLFGTIALNNSDAIKGINDTTSSAESAKEKIGAAFEKIGGFAVKAGQTIAAGLAVGATAIAGLTKQSLENYAEYEQLVGGIETLFGNSQGKVLQFAQNAYKAAGMSANEYMNTVTSFSASLLQGLDGDTRAAAIIANRAITDMSDNANKMGTDISMIQNAYQGFAKQNYTMLDNLKLGYGGTQSEMARLVNESGVLGETIEVTAETINDVSFDKIIQAIGVVQDRMGITGTTAREASSTIQGSVAATKAAWTNLLTGMSDDTADLEELVNEFVESVGTAAENIIPRIEIALEGAGELIDRLLPVIVEKVPQIINDVLPKILNSAVSIVQNLVNGIRQNQGTISQTAFDMVTTIIKAVTSLLPQITALGMELLVTIANGIVENLDELTDSAVEMVQKIVETLTDPETLENLLDAAIEIILAIAEGLVESLPGLTDAAISVITKITDVLTEEDTLTALIDAAAEIIIAVATGMIKYLSELTEAAIRVVTKLTEELTKEDTLDELVDASIAILEEIATGIIDNLPVLIEATIELVAKLIEYLLDPANLSKVLLAAFDLIKKLCEGLSLNAEQIKEKAEELGAVFADTLRNLDWSGLGASIGEMIWSGLDLLDELLMPEIIDAKTGQPVQKKTYSMVAGTHADGLDYVPYDGYIAELHKGEMVVPAAESRILRSGGYGVANAEVVQMLERILYAVEDSGNITLSINNREFARMVKAVT